MKRPSARWLVVGWSLLAVVIAGGCRRPEPPPAPAPPGGAKSRPAAPRGEAAQIESLTKGIETLQLVGRMDLTPEQRKALLAAVEAAVPAAEARQARRAETAAELIRALEDKTDALLAGHAPSAEDEARLRRLEARYQATTDPDPGDIGRLRQTLSKALSPQQVRLLAGSVEARIRAGDVLDGYRKLPQDEFEAQIGGLAEELATESHNLTAEQLQALFRDARTLSDAEYKAGRDKLLDQLEPLFLPGGDAMWAAIYDRLASAETADLLRRQGAPAP